FAAEVAAHTDFNLGRGDNVPAADKVDFRSEVFAVARINPVASATADRGTGKVAGHPGDVVPKVARASEGLNVDFGCQAEIHLGLDRIGEAEVVQVLQA